MQKIFLMLTLFAFSSCGKQELADRDDGRDDHYRERRYNDDDDDRDYRDDRDDRRPWWYP